MSRPPVDLLAFGETMALITPTGHGLVEGAPLALGIGGAESNVAVGAAALGIRSAWASRVGDDPLGRMVLAAVASRGVDVASVHVDATHPTGLMVKQPAPTGSRVFYYRAGSAASKLSTADMGRFPRARIVHTTGITPALSASARELVEAVLDGGLGPAMTSLDVNYRPALWPSPHEAAITLRGLAGRAHIVLVGRDEAEALWGTTTADSVRELLPEVPHLIVKDGSIEAVEFEATPDGDRVTRVAAQRVDVVEQVGAGDAFAAGWLVGHLRDASPEDRLRGGHASAAAVLRSPFDTVVPPDVITRSPAQEEHR